MDFKHYRVTLMDKKTGEVIYVYNCINGGTATNARYNAYIEYKESTENDIPYNKIKFRIEVLPFH